MKGDSVTQDNITGRPQIPVADTKRSILLTLRPKLLFLISEWSSMLSWVYFAFYWVLDCSVAALGWERAWNIPRQREICMGQAINWLTSLCLLFHWLDFSHMIIPNHNGGWEMRSNYVFIEKWTWWLQCVPLWPRSQLMSLRR